MPGQDGHRSTAAVTAVSVLVAGTLLSAVGVAAFQSDTASAATVLREAAGAQVVLADGTRRAGVAGERLAAGTTVELSGDGRVVLQTRDREVHLAPASSVQVLDGARQRLRSGTAFVDATDAPGLVLKTVAGTVDVRSGALVRVETGAVPRVGVLRADDDGARVRAPGRRTATAVPAYRQVQVPRGGLPGSVVPLRLTEGDRLEMELASDLVAADGYLNRTGDMLQGASPQAAVVRTALTEQAPQVPTDREGAIAFLVASAADGGVSRSIDGVRGLRDEGGSWGVVAALVDAGVDEIGARLDELLAPTSVALASGDEELDVIAALGLGAVPAAPGTGPGAGGLAGPDGSGTGDGDGSDGGGGSGGGSGGGGGGGDDDDDSESPPSGPLPTPLPSPLPQDPVDTVEETVDTVVDTVLDLVSPSPSPSGSATSVVPSPAPLSVPKLPLPSTSPLPLLP